MNQLSPLKGDQPNSVHPSNVARGAAQVTRGEYLSCTTPAPFGSENIKLVHITTVPSTLDFFVGQIAYLQHRGIQVHAVSAPGSRLLLFAEREHVLIHPVAMERRITPLRDLLSILRLWRILRGVRPTVVHAHTPKGGIVGMAAAVLAGVRLRIFHIHGLPHLTASGYRRLLLVWSTYISCLLANRVLCVSRSIRAVAISEGLCQDGKIFVLANGSVNGVDATGLFDPAKVDNSTRHATRARYGLSANASVLGFVGRIVRDKGLIELCEAWSLLRQRLPNLHLLIVGEFEPQDPLPQNVESLLRHHDAIHLTGFSDNLGPLYAVMDVVILPSYREGFPVVPLEAAAMALPVVATDVPGCRDAVEDGVTGTLVPPYDAAALAGAIERYLSDPDLCNRHGQAGRARVLRDFVPQTVWEAVYREYTQCL